MVGSDAVPSTYNRTLEEATSSNLWTFPCGPIREPSARLTQVPSRSHCTLCEMIFSLNSLITTALNVLGVSKAISNHSGAVLWRSAPHLVLFIAIIAGCGEDGGVRALLPAVLRPARPGSSEGRGVCSLCPLGRRLIARGSTRLGRWPTRWLGIDSSFPSVPSREKAALEPRRGGVSGDERARSARKCCDLGSHDGRSAWLAAKKWLKRNPARRVPSLALQEFRAEHQLQFAGPRRI